MSDGNNPIQRKNLECLASNLSDCVGIITQFTDYRFVDHATWEQIESINDSLQLIASRTAQASLVCTSVERARARQSYSKERSKKGK